VNAKLANKSVQKKVLGVSVPGKPFPKQNLVMVKTTTATEQSMTLTLKKVKLVTPKSRAFVKMGFINVQMAHSNVSKPTA
tara:strand:+ start:6876 stop:7115 length:240 start_codon:yes stop_codon:yes gene_type:complete